MSNYQNYPDDGFNNFYGRHPGGSGYQKASNDRGKGKSQRYPNPRQEPIQSDHLDSRSHNNWPANKSKSSSENIHEFYQQTPKPPQSTTSPKPPQLYDLEYPPLIATLQLKDPEISFDPVTADKQYSPKKQYNQPQPYKRDAGQKDFHRYEGEGLLKAPEFPKARAYPEEERNRGINFRHPHNDSQFGPQTPSYKDSNFNKGYNNETQRGKGGHPMVYQEKNYSGFEDQGEYNPNSYGRNTRGNNRKYNKDAYFTERGAGYEHENPKRPENQYQRAREEVKPNHREIEDKVKGAQEESNQGLSFHDKDKDGRVVKPLQESSPAWNKNSVVLKPHQHETMKHVR